MTRFSKIAEFIRSMRASGTTTLVKMINANNRSIVIVKHNKDKPNFKRAISFADIQQAGGFERTPVLIDNTALLAIVEEADEIIERQQKDIKDLMSFVSKVATSVPQQIVDEAKEIQADISQKYRFI